MSHTPGPWWVHWTHDFNGYPRFYIHGFAGDQKRDVAAMDANARLIAAAPELLEALRLLHNETAEYVTINNLGDPHQNHSMQLARAAIAKAEGR